MNLTTNLRRFAAISMLGLVAATAPSASLAAQTDIELLKSYVGEWKGRGSMETNGEKESVACKLSIVSGGETKVNYNGRCTVAGATLQIAGTMAYVDQHSRFEAVMTSNTSFSGLAIGKRRGSGIDFNLKDRNADTGAEFAILAGMELKGEIIDVEFSVTETGSGNRIAAVIPFKK
jgi:hypothetical protein